MTRVVTLWFYQFESHYPVRHLTSDQHQGVVAEWSKALIYLSWGGVAWVQIQFEWYIFILNFLLPPRSEQLSGAHANEIKHDNSHVVIIV